MYVILSVPQYIVYIDQKRPNGLACEIEKRGVRIRAKVLVKEWMTGKMELLKKKFLKKSNLFL